MREIQASEAKTHLPRLLTDVERGETIVITRHGRVVARLVPPFEDRKEQTAKTIENIKKLRDDFTKVTLSDCLDARHEGHNR